jgi:hypothetical protein
MVKQRSHDGGGLNILVHGNIKRRRRWFGCPIVGAHGERPNILCTTGLISFSVFIWSSFIKRNKKG